MNHVTHGASFYSVNERGFLTPPGQDTNQSQFSSADAGAHLPTQEGWKAELA